MSTGLRLSRLSMVFAAVCGVAACGVLLLRPWAGSMQPNRLSVHFLNVGQGDAIFIRTPDNTTALIDGGPDNAVLYELGARMPWWKRRLDYVILTHADSDHYAGIRGVLDKYDIGMILYNGDEQGGGIYLDFLQTVRERDIKLVRVSKGTAVELQQGIQLSFLWPPPDHSLSDDNDASLVTQLIWGRTSALFMADVSVKVEAAILAEYPDLSARILKLGHHGSRTSSGEEFVRRIAASWCVASAGGENRFNHPHADVVERVQSAGCEVIGTSEEGTISFVLDGVLIRRR